MESQQGVGYLVLGYLLESIDGLAHIFLQRAQTQSLGHFDHDLLYISIVELDQSIKINCLLVSFNRLLGFALKKKFVGSIFEELCGHFKLAHFLESFNGLVS